MRPLFLLVDEFSRRLDLRTRRALLVGCMAGLTLFARSTLAAIQGSDLPNTVAGFALLLMCAAGAAMACTGRTTRH